MEPGYQGDPIDLPEGSTLNGVDANGLAWVKGPQGNVVGHDPSTLSDGSKSMLGLDAGSAGPADAGTAGPTDAGATTAPGSDGLVPAPASFGTTPPAAPPAEPGLWDRVTSAATAHPYLAALATGPVAPAVIGTELGIAGARAVAPKLMGTTQETVDQTKAVPAGYQPPPAPDPSASPTTPVKPAELLTGGGGGGGASDLSGAENKAVGQEQADTMTAAKTEGDIATAKAGNTVTNEQAQAQAQADAQAKLKQIHDETVARYQQYDAEQKKLDDQHEDPNHWWDSRTTGQRVAATISMALGGFAEGFGIHDASPVQKYIQQDIDAQRQNYERSSKNLAAKRSAYADYRAAGLSDNEATLLLTKNQLQSSLNVANAMVDQKTAGPLVQQRAKILSDKLGTELVQTDAKLKNEAAQTTLTRVETQGKSQENQIQKIQFNQGQAQKQAGGVVPGSPQAKVAVQLPDGRTVMALDEESAKKQREKEETAQTYISGLKKLKDIYAAHPVASQWPSETQSEAEALRKEIAGAKASFRAGKDNPARGALLDKFEKDLPGGGAAPWVTDRAMHGLDTEINQAQSDLLSSRSANLIGFAGVSNTDAQDKAKAAAAKKYGGV